MYCFAFGCNCHDSYKRCSFFRFPANKMLFKKWEALCRRKDRSAKPNDRLCSCHFKDGKKENGASIFAWNKDKVFDFPKVADKQPRRKDRPVKPFDRICSCHFKESVKTNGPSIFPWNQGQLFDFSSLPVRKHVTRKEFRNDVSYASSSGAVGSVEQQVCGACLVPCQTDSLNAPSCQSNVDVTKRLRLFRRGIAESRPAIKLLTRSSSPPEFGSEQDKRLLQENHRDCIPIVCIAPPGDDHNYGVTEIQLPWCSPVGKRKHSQSPVAYPEKMRVSTPVEDEVEKLKIVEGANALLNLAGIKLEPSMTPIMSSRSISPVLPTNIEVKSET